MRQLLMARLLLVSFDALVLCILLYGLQDIHDTDTRRSSLFYTQIVDARAQSGLPELSSIELSNCTLDPSFTPAVTSYSCTVPYNITFVTFTVTTDYPNTITKIYPVTIIVGGPIGFSLYTVGKRTLYIEVISGEATRTYQVTVTRLAFVPSPSPTSTPIEVPEADTLILVGIGTGGLATWVGWQRKRIQRRV